MKKVLFVLFALGCLNMSSYASRLEAKASNEVENRFFQHEFGHVCQSGAFGVFYMSKIAIPSFFVRHLGIQDSDIELDANRRAFRFFNNHINGFYTAPEDYDRFAIHTHGWDFGSNHLFQVNDGSPYLDYNDAKTQKMLQDKLKFISVDYFFFPHF